MTDGVYGRIYLITNTANGKQYVGQTTLSLEKRWRSHRHAMSNPRRDQPITAALRKYGPEKFTMVELATCGDRESLDAAERDWAERLGTFAPAGYNLVAGAGAGALSEQVRERLRQAMTPERRAHLRELWKGRRLPDAAYASAAQRRAERRVPWTLLDPTGAAVTLVHTVKSCQAAGLAYENLRLVAFGLRPSHKGWRLLPPQPAPALEAAGNRLLCPSCGDAFPTDMRAPASTHAKACAFVEVAVPRAVELGHLTSDEAGRRLAAYRAKLGTLRAVPPKTKSFRVVDPDGTLIEATGVKAFVAERGLTLSKFSDLLNGRIRRYRGWRLAPEPPQVPPGGDS